MVVGKGLYTALVTPFEKGQIHKSSLVKLVEDQLNKGVDGFVVLGTTGESSCLSQAEKKQVFDIVSEVVSGQVPLIVGAGSNCTQTTVESSFEALEWGADALLLVTPYYNKPPQRGLEYHYRQVADQVKAPILLYDVPSRTGVSLSLEVIGSLSSHPYIIGIKDATGDMSRVKSLLEFPGGKKEFLVLSGDDGTFLPFLKEGGHGAISVLSHVLPSPMKSWMSSIGDKISEEDFKNSLKLIDQLFIESNPIPVKMALFLQGLISSPELRSPLVSLEERLVQPLQEELNRWN